MAGFAIPAPFRFSMAAPCSPFALWSYLVFELPLQVSVIILQGLLALSWLLLAPSCHNDCHFRSQENNTRYLSATIYFPCSIWNNHWFGMKTLCPAETRLFFYSRLLYELWWTQPRVITNELCPYIIPSAWMTVESVTCFQPVVYDTGDRIPLSRLSHALWQRSRNSTDVIKVPNNLFP